MCLFFNTLTVTKIILRLILLVGLILGIFTSGISQQYYFNSVELDNSTEHNETINKMINAGTRN